MTVRMLEEAVATLREVRHTGKRNLKMPNWQPTLGRLRKLA
jgi:hypothetical protein